MTEIIGFDNLDDMYGEIKRRTSEGNAHLSDQQQALTFGSTWCQFAFHLDPRLVIFGRVFTVEELRAQITAEEGSDAEAAAHVRQVKSVLEDGYMYGNGFSYWEPSGELGDTHRYNAWPIGEALYHAAQEVGGRIDDLPVEHKVALQVAYEQWLEWNRAEGDKAAL